MNFLTPCPISFGKKGICNNVYVNINYFNRFIFPVYGEIAIHFKKKGCSYPLLTP